MSDYKETREYPYHHVAMSDKSETPRKAEHVLADEGVFAGHAGLRGLHHAREFWDAQMYGTRLYYGGGPTDYLHHGVLGAAISALDKMGALQAELAAAKEEIAKLKGRAEDEIESLRERLAHFGCPRVSDVRSQEDGYYKMHPIIHAIPTERGLAVVIGPTERRAHPEGT